MSFLSVADKNQLIKLEYPRRWLSTFKSNKERQMPHFPRTKECPFFTGGAVMSLCRWPVVAGTEQ